MPRKRHLPKAAVRSGAAPNYVDTGKQRPQDNVNLDVYIESGDRAVVGEGEAQPFFSGRQLEVDAFWKTLIHFGRGVRENLTFVIEGPPGAGKSALMAQCMSEMRAFTAPPNEGRWLPVRLPAAATGSPAEIAIRINRAIARRMATSVGRPERQHLVRTISDLAGKASQDEREAVQMAARFVESASEKLAVAPKKSFDRVMERVRREAHNFRTTASNSAAAGKVAEILDRGGSVWGVSIGAKAAHGIDRFHEVVRVNERAWEPYNIVLFVDEAQNVPVDTRLEHVRDFFSSIHEGTVSASLAVCVFGLTGTTNKLRAAGVSRLQARRFWRLGALAVDDCRKAVCRCFEQFGARKAKRWEDLIIKRSSRWPQHLAGYLTSAMAEIRRYPTGEEGFDASKADIRAALAQGDEIRRYYYAGRAEALGTNLERARALADSLQDKESAVSGSEIRAVLNAHHGGAVSDDSFHDFMASALYSGFLAPDARDAKGYVMPIPSFAAFLRDEDPEPIEQAVSAST